jgi:hypothetical protein
LCTDGLESQRSLLVYRTGLRLVTNPMKDLSCVLTDSRVSVPC